MKKYSSKNFFFRLNRNNPSWSQNEKNWNDQEVIVLGQNEIDIQLKNIENLKRQHFQMDYKKSQNNSQLVSLTLKTKLIKKITFLFSGSCFIRKCTA